MAMNEPEIIDDKNGDEQLSMNEIRDILHKYDEVNKEKKKYITLFIIALILIILVLSGVVLAVIFGGDLLSKNEQIETNHDEHDYFPHSEFVTLQESETDIPIVTFEGFLDVPLQEKNQTNYSRIISDGEVIENFGEYTMDIYYNFSNDIPDNQDLFLSIQEQIFKGRIEYNILEQACHLLFTGHSQFTLRHYSDPTLPKSISNLQITSEQCDFIEQGLPTTATFKVDGHNHFVECLDGNNDLCQVYMENEGTLKINNNTLNQSSITEEEIGRRRRRMIVLCPERFTTTSGKTCVPRGSNKPTVAELINAGIILPTPQSLITKAVGAINGFIRAATTECIIANINRPTIRCAPGPGKSDEYECCSRSGGCFPEDSVVNTPDGDKLIQDINVGDKVLTMNTYTNKLEYSDIYMHGHRMSDVEYEYVTLYTDNDIKSVEQKIIFFMFVMIKSVI